MFKSFIGIVSATVIVFAWGSVSWMLLPFHEASIHQFENQEAVTAAILEAAKDGAGVYVSPYTEGMTEAESQAAYRKGPMIFTSIRPGSDADYTMGSQFLRAVLATLVAALILGIMLSAAAPRLNYIGRVLFVTLGGAFAAVAATYPNQIWWEFPVSFIGISMIDHVVGWFLAGLAMAGLINGKS